MITVGSCVSAMLPFHIGDKEQKQGYRMRSRTTGDSERHATVIIAILTGVPILMQRQSFSRHERSCHFIQQIAMTGRGEAFYV